MDSTFHTAEGIELYNASIMEFNNSLSQLPNPSAKRIALRISPPAERALRQGHPWIFDQSITEQSHQGAPGDLAVIFDDKRRFLAIGLYDPTSPIRVRILQSRDPATINTEWFQNKLKIAAQTRAHLEKEKTTGYRLVHGENDGLPGLVIDRYADTLVLKLYTPAWIPHLKSFCDALAQVNTASHLILRLNRSLQKQTEFLHHLNDGMTITDQTSPSLILFQENGLTFESDPIHGQKTGFFLDQRENRTRVEKFSKNKTVLNVFAYTGGFSVYAARGGAKEVTSVDISPPAIEAAIRNMKHNQHFPTVASAQHETFAEDAFEVLARMQSQKRLFDVVIIDPPMFAQSEKQTAGALSAYRKLTQLGLGVLRRGGMLVQASCSSRVDSDSFFESIHRSAQEAGRSLIEIERTGHALDHPIRFIEGAYLKCLFATA
ncbi:MAG TPA: class I SAM-dependent rRNA methyltransferase [Anaerolineales bacterium]|nr:class I SAM-dependent rRNA methyltransferase [Anaerolineales bacterium]HUM24845.1 class I SAM-dependent rRNA methyltransferase [Anaerolineales bacterium]